MSRNTGTMHGFDELAASRKAPTIALVALPTRFVTAGELQEGTTALQLAAENLRRKKAAQAQAEGALLESVREFMSWMTDIALRHLADIAGFVRELGEDYLQEEYAGVQPEQEQGESADAEKKLFTVGDWQKQLRDEIDKYLNCGDPRVSLLLEATEIAFWLSYKSLSKEELTGKTRQLVKDNILVQDRHGDIEVLGGYYFIHKRFDALKEPLKTEVKAKIRDAIRAQANRIREEEKQAKMAKTAEVKTKIAHFIAPCSSDLPILDVLDEAKTGRCGALVSGGGIWFQVNAENIEILDVTGAPENGFDLLKAVEETYPDHKVRISRKTLKGKDGGLARASESLRIQIPLEISKNKDDSDDWIKANKFAWHAVRGAIEFAIECRRKAIQGLLHDEFHEGELGKYKPGMEGFVYKIFGPDRNVEKEILMTDSQLEVERFETEAEDVMIRVTGYNPEFTELLEKQGCLSSEGFPEGQRFDGCPHLIKLVLQRDFGLKSKAPVQPEAEDTDKTRVANVCADLTRFQ